MFSLQLSRSATIALSCSPPSCRGSWKRERSIDTHYLRLLKKEKAMENNKGRPSFTKDQAPDVGYGLSDSTSNSYRRYLPCAGTKTRPRHARSALTI